MLARRLPRGTFGLPQGAIGLPHGSRRLESTSVKGKSAPVLQRIVRNSFVPPSPDGSLTKSKTWRKPLERMPKDLAQSMLQFDIALRMLAAVYHFQQTTIDGPQQETMDEPHPETIEGMQQKTTGEPDTRMLAPRTLMIYRLIGIGRVLSAMTAFTQDTKNPRRNPYTIRELELIMRALRVRSQAYGAFRPRRMNNAPKGPLWRPSVLPADIDPKDLPVPQQCAFAMAAVYDTCIELKLQVTSNLVSPMLATFLTHLGRSQMLLATQTALNDLAKGPNGIKEFSHRVISSFLLIFGAVGQPKLGEQLLHQWAMQQPADKALSSSAMGVNLTGWSQNCVLWTSLVISRINAQDLRGARAWLQEFRSKGLPLVNPDRDPQRAGLPQRPYLAYMIGLVKANQIPNHQADGVRSIPRHIMAELHSVFQLMLRDCIPINDQVRSFILDVSTASGQIRESLDLLAKFPPVDPDMLFTRSSMLQSLFKLRAAIAKLEDSSDYDKQHMPTTRHLISQLVRAGKDEFQNWPRDPSNQHSKHSFHRGMLDDALRAALAERDYPAAIVVIDAFSAWHIQPWSNSYSIIFSTLLQQGHRFILHQLHSNAEESIHRMSHAETEQHLQTMVGSNSTFTKKQTEGQLAALRAAHARGHIDATVYSAKASSPLSIDYLTLILSKACDAEVERSRTSALPAQWLPKSVDMTRPASDVAYDAIESARKELSSVGISPQVPSSSSDSPMPKPSLFSRRTFLPPSTRSFSTAAVSRTETSSSCSLSTANDHKELEPVRVQYVPGFVPYKLGLALQEHLVGERANARAALRSAAASTSTSAGVASGHHSIEPSHPEAALHKIAKQDTLLLLQHRPVYTEGRREENENELMSKHLRALGADYSLTKRGGQITYHGPGQLVGYPILDLGAMNLASRCYVDRVQDTLIGMLAEQGIKTVEPPENHTGVWTDAYHKIASIGIQVRHRISSHGFALNVEPRSMRGFAHIVACGIVGRSMTCMAEHTTHTVTVPDAAQLVTRHFAQVFGRQTRPATPDEFEFTTADEDAATLMTGLKIPIEPGEQVVTAINVDGKPVIV